jgi:predicted PurR-regulated permease PerM
MMRLKLLDKKTAQVLLTALLFGVALLFLYAAWRILIAFLFAIFFAYLLEAPVSHLERWFKGSRVAAISVVYLIFIALLVVVFLMAGPPVVQEAQKFMQQAPHFTDKLNEVVSQHGFSAENGQRIQKLVNEHRGEIIGSAQNMLVRAAQSLQKMWWLLLVPILAIFFLKEGRRFGEIIIHSVKGQRNRQIVASTVEEMNSMLGHFIRAQLLLAALAIVVITFVLWLMRVPYAVALGPAAGALEFIPVVGPFLGIVLVFSAAFLANYSHPFVVLLFLLVWRGIQDYVTSPRIMGSKLELHPLAVLFAILAGGEVAGVIGVFLSIPVLATIRILWHTWQLYRNSSASHLQVVQKEIS